MKTLPHLKCTRNPEIGLNVDTYPSFSARHRKLDMSYDFRDSAIRSIYLTLMSDNIIELTINISFNIMTLDTFYNLTELKLESLKHCRISHALSLELKPGDPRFEEVLSQLQDRNIIDEVVFKDLLTTYTFVSAIATPLNFKDNNFLTACFFYLLTSYHVGIFSDLPYEISVITRQFFKSLQSLSQMNIPLINESSTGELKSKSFFFKKKKLSTDSEDEPFTKKNKLEAPQ